MVSVLLLLGIAVGASLAIESFAALNIIGFGALSGIVSGVGAVRVIGPLVGGIAFAAQTGCRMTAEIGAMRIADEIDAVEAMGLGRYRSWLVLAWSAGWRVSFRDIL